MGSRTQDTKVKEKRQKNRQARKQRQAIDQLENEIIDQAFIIIEELMIIIKTQINEDQSNNNIPQSRGIVNARNNTALDTPKPMRDRPVTNNTAVAEASNVTIEVNHPRQPTSRSEPTFQYQPANTGTNSDNVRLSQGSQVYPGMENSIPPSNSSRNALFERLRGPIQPRSNPSIVNPTQMNNAIRNQHLAQSRPEQAIVGQDAFQFANRLVSRPTQTNARSSSGRPTTRSSTVPVRRANRSSTSSVTPVTTSSMRAPSVAIAA
jgi:hypothetical protein